MTCDVLDPARRATAFLFIPAHFGGAPSPITRPTGNVAYGPILSAAKFALKIDFFHW